MSADALFDVCPLPGCGNAVDDPREPCWECRTTFGEHLQKSGDAAPSRKEFAAAVAERDRGVREVYAQRREPFTVAAVEVPPVKRPEGCACSCKSCQGAYAHCLRHGTGCHLTCRSRCGEVT